MTDVITDCPEELSPQEIVAALHAEIAALSPGHAALVAEYEALPRRRRGPRPPRAAVMRSTQERMGTYARWRASGLGKKAAARRTGIAVRTASRYEQDISDGRLEAPGD